MGRNEHFDMIETLPSLPPLVHPEVAALIGPHRGLIAELVHGFGPALHVVLPEVFSANVKQFQHVLDTASVDGLILFAKKANKARSFAQRCPELGIGIDAASMQEAEQALGCGVPGPQIGISGPAKHPDLLRLALRQRCLVAIDSVDELQRFVALAAHSRCQGRILLRQRPAAQPNSRFGMTPDECEQALQLCLAQRAQVTLEGFSFHLSGYSPAARAACAHQLIDACDAACRRGLTQCQTVNIGGGFAVSYARQEDWQAFLAHQQAAHYHAGKSFAEFYPYYSPSHGAGMLAEILADATHRTGQSLALRLRQQGLRLMLEPGRALLDHAGFTAFQVQGVKDRAASEGYGILTVGGTSFSLSEQWFNSEYLPDPLLLDDTPGERPYAACVGGASCLDSDMVSWRKVRFARRPHAGDVLLYLNTAGYQMDSNESPFHDLPLPPKLAISIEHDTPRWRLDGGSTTSYNPIQ